MEAAGHTCAGFIEIDKFAVKSYRVIYDTEGEFYANDIRNVVPGALPEGIDCFCGGFPCQAFSIAGKRRGFEDTRGTLIYEVLRLASVYKPRLLFLENVGGLLTHDGGRTFTTILRAISELGYVCEWQCINSKAYLPQNRYRVYLIGHLGELPRQTVFPIPEMDGKNTIKVIGEVDVQGWLRMNRFIHSVDGVSPTVDTRGHSKGKIYIGGKVRHLTTLECWRLQGFPDWAYERAAAVNSTVQLYKQAGNSVSVPVIEAIAQKIKEIE